MKNVERNNRESNVFSWLSNSIFSISKAIIANFSQENIAENIIPECIGSIKLTELNDNQVQVDFEISDPINYLSEDMHDCMPYLSSVENLVYFFKYHGFTNAYQPVNISMGPYTEAKFTDYKSIYGELQHNSGEECDSICENVILNLDRITFVFSGKNLLTHLTDNLTENFPNLLHKNLALKC